MRTDKRTIFFITVTGVILLALVLFSAIVIYSKDTHQTNHIEYVNPFIGTLGSGHTFPGVTVPFGLVQLSPQTGNHDRNYSTGYQYDDSFVTGFAHTRQIGKGIGDLSDVLIIPLKDEKYIPQMNLPVDKQKEVASPGYYSTFLSNDKIKVELTATQRTGMHRYTFSNSGNYRIVMDANHTLFSWAKDYSKSRVLDAKIYTTDFQTVCGFLQSDNWVKRQVYFVAKFNKAFKAENYPEGFNKRVMELEFAMKEGEALEIQVAISTVSIEGAYNNLHQESYGREFETIKKEAVSQWEQYLSLIDIEADEAQKTNFYTALYRLFIQPNNIADIDGSYRGADGKVYQSKSGQYYSTFSMWDTYRAAHPLYTILIPQKNSAFIGSMLTHADIEGFLPIWTLWGKENYCMIGNHAVSVIADAMMKDLPGFDYDQAYKHVKNNLTRNNWAKYNWNTYDKYGYLPNDSIDMESVSLTLEAAFNDWCAAQMAYKLGKQEDYTFFIKRSDNYKNLFDSTTNLMRGKKSNGEWYTPFDPLSIENHAGYTGGNAWQNTWHVQHDIPGLINLMGGAAVFEIMLDSFFIRNTKISASGGLIDDTGSDDQFWRRSEPSQHVAYLYNYIGKYRKTQKLIPEILASQYQNSPDGLHGNNDCGQMSAWYILSSLGFYPVNPASGYFNIGVPAFKRARITVGENTFQVKAPKLSEQNKYVGSVKLNGKEIKDYQIHYSDIMKGGTLEFEMTNAY